MKNYIISLIILLSSFSVKADRILITSGNVDPIPLAINTFAGIDPADLDFAKKITDVMSKDLNNSGVFRPISHAAFIERKIGTLHTPLFAAWQQINANLLVNGDVRKLSSGKIQVKFILWDTILERELIGETFELPEKLWRRVAHKIADKIYSKVTGYNGYFDSRIVYVSESGPYLQRKKRLAIMDQDGANHQYLTDGSDLVLTPRFSPDGKKILYLSYKNFLPKVYNLDLRTGRSSLLGHFPGMSFAPRFSPDGTHAVVSIAKNGSTHIYEMNLSNKKTWPLTNGTSINTSPTYSPDGKHIVFNSDRNGRRQLFMMDRSGANVKLISFGGGTYAEPNWSGSDHIAFTKISRDYGFTIGIMRADTNENSAFERILTSGFLVESPCWANNGRVIAFTKGSKPRNNNNVGLNRIYTVDFTGYNERIIPTPHDASDPDWSKLLD